MGESLSIEVSHLKVRADQDIKPPTTRTIIMLQKDPRPLRAPKPHLASLDLNFFFKPPSSVKLVQRLTKINMPRGEGHFEQNFVELETMLVCGRE